MKTPNIFIVFLYYLLVSIYISGFYKKIKENFNKNRKNIIIVICLFLSAFVGFNINKGKLKIYFIDVGQGDATLIVTPKNKKILIDGGGDEQNDVGKNTLLPYLLDRNIKSLDYIIISHFDSDHCMAAMYVMEKIEIKNVIVGKQFEENENLESFIEIINKKKINLITANEDEKIVIENDLYFDVLWPENNRKILENSINNNALVLKLNYINKNSFAMLFTGDIEKETENILVKKYQNTNILNSQILKVAHHGSDTSSTEKFIKLVSPKISLIGVGKDNSYGHPSKKTLENLTKIRFENI